ncbi:THAP domain-containing protein 9, partial [Aphis craccivora]
SLTSYQTADEDDLTLLTPTKTYNKYKTSTEVELIFPSPSSIISTPQKEKISDLIDMPSPSYKRKHSLQNNLKNLVNAYKFPSCNSRALVTMQLKTKRRTWATEERNLAFTLFYKSPTAYNFLRLQKINLPAPSTIRRWIGESKFLPGFNNYFFDHVQKKFEHKSYKEKACNICFDEMYIKEFLEYSKQYDFIEGFQDLGTY